MSLEFIRHPGKSESEAATWYQNLALRLTKFKPSQKIRPEKHFDLAKYPKFSLQQIRSDKASNRYMKNNETDQNTTQCTHVTAQCSRIAVTHS